MSLTEVHVIYIRLFRGWLKLEIQKPDNIHSIQKIPLETSPKCFRLFVVHLGPVCYTSSFSIYNFTDQQRGQNRSLSVHTSINENNLLKNWFLRIIANGRSIFRHSRLGHTIIKSSQLCSNLFVLLESVFFVHWLLFCSVCRDWSLVISCTFTSMHLQ